MGRWTEDEVEYLREHAHDMSATDIAEELGRTQNSVNHYAHRHDISMSKPHSVYADKISKSRREYGFDEDFFAKDTPEANYWAGALLADGCIDERNKNSHTIKLHISKKDLSWLKKFKESLEAEHPIREDGDFIRLKIHSNKMFDDLKRFGVVPRKTYKNSIPNVSSKMLQHFIRGLFDGDGSIHRQGKYNANRISLTNTEQVCKWWDEELNNFIGISGSLYPHSNSEVAWRWESQKQENVEKFATFIYRDANNYMNRKLDRFMDYGVVSRSEVML